jgi:DNA-binding MarR family transcriptional regulator
VTETQQDLAISKIPIFLIEGKYCPRFTLVLLLTFSIVIVIIIIVMIFKDKFQRIYELSAMITMKSRRAIQACLKPYGITFDQFGTIMALINSEGMNQRQLAAAMETDTTTAMVICDGLEKRGLILRVRNPKDRRTNKLYVTDKGRKLIERAFIAVGQVGLPLTEVLSEEEVDRITPLLERLASKAKEIAETARRQASRRIRTRSHI